MKAQEKGARNNFVAGLTSTLMDPSLRKYSEKLERTMNQSTASMRGKYTMDDFYSDNRDVVSCPLLIRRILTLCLCLAQCISDDLVYQAALTRDFKAITSLQLSSKFITEIGKYNQSL